MVCAAKVFFIMPQPISPPPMSLTKPACLLTVVLAALHASLLAAGPALAAAPAAAPLPPIPRPAHATPALLKTLAAWDRERAADARRCLQQAARSARQSSYRLRYRVALQHPALHAVQYEVFSDCGGPYPSAQASGATFEVATGARYHPARLYRIGQPAAQAFEYFASSLTPAVAQLVRSRLLEQGGADCEEVLWQLPLERAEAITLGQDSLHIHVPAAQAVQACVPGVELPYELIHDRLDPAEALRLGWRR